jgi:preprotein translocase YajC subunit
MTATLALLHLIGTTKKSNPLITLLPLLLIGVAGYFFFIKPQQRKAAAARGASNNPIEVGDEVQTIGGVIGTVLEIHGDRYTLLTGALGSDGNLDGPQPTRIVFIRAAIARKIDRVGDLDDVDDLDDADADADADDHGQSHAAGGRQSHGEVTEIEDDGPDEAAHADHDGGEEEAEEA